MIDEKTGVTRAGRWMISLAWIFALLLLTYLFSNALEHKRNPNRNVETSYIGETKQVVLKSSTHGHYVASGQINQLPVVFLVDTGASFVSVPAGLAKKLGLKKGTLMWAQTANGQVSTYATVIDKISLGDISLTNVSASINPHMSGNEVLLGMSFLRQLEVIHKDGELTIRQ